jgi:hypothetical protein
MARKKNVRKYVRYSPPREGARVLIFDIETAPILAHVWGLWDNNVSLNQMVADWYVLSWSAKWLGSPDNEVMYMDQRDAKTPENDNKILKEIWSLLNEADVVITQNGKSFDQRRLQARFLILGFSPNTPYKHIDVKVESQRLFGFPSHKLEYMTEKVNKKYKKLKHKKFPGHDLWVECLKGNKEAWDEMRLYNVHDVLSLEEFFGHIAPWGINVNFNLYHDGEEHICKCGSKEHIKNGFYYTDMGKYQKYECKKCGAPSRDRHNLFTPEKRRSLRRNVPR